MSNKPLANPNSFTGVSPPWSLTQLDANFSALQAVINDTLTYSNYFVDQSGVANSIIVSIQSTLTVALTAGTLLSIKIANTNTGAVTMTVNALVAQSVVNQDGSAMSPSQLIAGQIALFEYDGTRFQHLGSGITPPFLRTAGEIAGGVTPSNFFYPPLDVRRYGAVGDSTTSDAAAFQRALNSIPAAGGRIIVPPPPTAWLIDATLNVMTGGTSIEGVGEGGSYLFQATHNVDFISIQAGNCEVRNIGFKCNAFGATQKFCVNSNASSDGLVLFNIRANNCFSFVNFLGVKLFASLFNVTNIQTTTGIGFQINNANATIILTQGLIGNGAGNQAFAGIYIIAGTSLQLIGLNLFKMGIPLYLLPAAAATVGNLYAVACYFDTSTTGLLADGSAAGSQVSSIDFVACWFNGHSSHGARLRGTVKGASFTGCQLNQNGANGLVVDASAAVQDLLIEGCRAAGNTTDGVQIGANVNLFHIKSNVLGPYGGVGGNGNNGLTITAGTGNNYEVINNDCHGNTGTGISNSATGTTCLVTGNTGNSSSQTAGITVTASPFTYTAGPSPETIYINTGTVSAVSVEGVTVYSQTNVTVKLRPKQSVVVTYTGAPGMAKTVEG